MINYVLCYVQIRERVLLIRKIRPAWQKDWFNLPGGKIEAGESIIQAAARELKEETGLDTLSTQIMGCLAGDDYTVYVVHCLLPDHHKPVYAMEDEEPVLLSFAAALNHPMLIPNLKIVIPLCHCGVKDWEIRDTGEVSNIAGMGLKHTVRL